MRQRNPQSLNPVLAEIVMCGLEVVERDAREVGKGLAALIAFTQGVREGE